MKRFSFKKGDVVEIVGNIPFHLQKKKRPLIGTVTNVNGSYILVRPKFQRWVAEFYPGEIKHYTSLGQERKKKLKKINKINKVNVILENNSQK